MPKLAVTKDKRLQRRIIADAERQSAKIGLHPTFKFNFDGELLIDGRTQAEIDARHDQAMKEFYADNVEYLDPDLIPEDPYEDMTPAPIYQLPVPMGPFPLQPTTVMIKFETKDGEQWWQRKYKPKRSE